MSLSSRLARVRSQAARVAASSGAPAVVDADADSDLPRREAAIEARPERSREPKPTAELTAALARFVDDERPTFRVDRLAALAGRYQVDVERADDGLLPGNGTGGSIDEGLLRIGGAESRRRLGDRRARVADVPPAMQFLALRAQGLTAPETLEVGSLPPVPLGNAEGAPETDPCTACGGATRVAMVDLVEDVATVECILCGLRREESAGSVLYGS